MKLYRSYMFRSKDPVIDQLRTVVQDKLKRNFSFSDLKQIEDDGGPTAGSMAKWFWGDTKRPQNSSIEAAGRSMGLMRVWVPLKLEENPMPKSVAKKRKKAKG
jgi:hypothetical protein